ncbi:MAG: DUF3857 domain-containing protein [Bacteroidetes bacterium]|nr:DUF3857 domain-containing protein [Bacteroidota bacterium]
MRTLLCIFCLSFFSLANGQFKEPKFGKIELSDLQMTRYNKDTTADALMLFDNGYSRFDINVERKFQFTYDRHYRIKIFRKSAFHYADVSIPLYQNGISREKLDDLSAVTYNLADGKVVKTKLSGDKIYKQEGKNLVIQKFAFPEVKEGSIIELSYRITSDFLYNFRGWTFQYNYPALWSQYQYIIPEYFVYRSSSKGYLPFSVYKSERGNAMYKLHYESQITPGLQGGRTSSEDYDIKAFTTENIIAVKDVPAFISEPNIDCEDNYIQSIEFELSSVQYPNELIRDYVQSWESVNKRMNDDEDFGKLLNSKGFIKDTVESLCNGKPGGIEKAITIYNYVQRKMKWNGDHSIWASKGLKKPFITRVGNSAEINLLLTLMMQTAGLDANPVLFSTRDNGIAITYYPTISKFNSVLVVVNIEGKVSLLDATSKYCPFGVLPANDINGRGRVVDNTHGDWADLNANEKYKEVKSYSLEINPEGKMTGTIIGCYGGYAGISYRDKLNHEKSSDDFIRKMQENVKGLTINKYSISDKDDNYKLITDTLNVEISDQAEIIGDKILFNPLLFERIEKNIYTLEERKYPVDYNFPISSTCLFEYTLPAGYQVESLPQPVSFKLPDNSISISYMVQSADNKIKVIYRRNISKMLFLPGEYADLKELYNQIVKKHSEQVILKKII